MAQGDEPRMLSACLMTGKYVVQCLLLLPVSKDLL